MNNSILHRAFAKGSLILYNEFMSRIYAPLIETNLVVKLVTKKTKGLCRQHCLIDNRTLNSSVIETKGTVSERKCIIHPDYNGLYDMAGNLIPGTSLARGHCDAVNAVQSIPISPDLIEERVDEAIYGGVLFARHYGHFLTETLARLWHILIQPAVLKNNIPIYFRSNRIKRYSKDGLSSFAETFFRHLGILERFVVIRHPTLVERMYIPEAVNINNGHTFMDYIAFMKLLGAELPILVMIYRVGKINEYIWRDLVATF